jgi:hypothetical protein
MTMMPPAGSRSRDVDAAHVYRHASACMRPPKSKSNSSVTFIGRMCSAISSSQDTEQDDER